MNHSTKYWNYATFAAISIGVCNVLPEYIDAATSSTIFTSLSLPWKLISSFLILFFLGKKIACEEIDPVMGYSYGQAFGWAYLSSILAGIVEGFLTVLYARVIVPDYLDKVKNMTMNIISEIPSYTPEMVSMAEKSLDKVLSTSGLILSSILGAAMAGAVMSLIVAAFIRKKINPMDE